MIIIMFEVLWELADEGEFGVEKLGFMKGQQVLKENSIWV